MNQDELNHSALAGHLQGRRLIVLFVLSLVVSGGIVTHQIGRRNTLKRQLVELEQEYAQTEKRYNALADALKQRGITHEKRESHDDH